LRWALPGHVPARRPWPGEPWRPAAAGRLRRADIRAVRSAVGRARRAAVTASVLIDLGRSTAASTGAASATRASVATGAAPPVGNLSGPVNTCRQGMCAGHCPGGVRAACMCPHAHAPKPASAGASRRWDLRGNHLGIGRSSRGSPGRGHR
jgi:hypothetical protein